MPADCLEKAVHTKTPELWYQKIRLSQRLPRKNSSNVRGKFNLEAVQHDGSTGKPVADEMTTEPKIELRIHGVPHQEVEQDEEKSRTQHIGRFVSAIMNHENKVALNAELESKHP